MLIDSFIDYKTFTIDALERNGEGKQRNKEM